jgi:tetratricopeptide (TPR) repeat protein
MAPSLLLVIGLAAFAGYRVGGREREQARQGEVQQIIQEQYSLGLLDLEQERFEIARQRFEYIIRLDPDFPGAAERLAEALLGLSQPLIPTPALVAATPTPNLAPVAEILEQARQAYDQGDWTGAIEQLLALRAKDAAYEPVQVDGLLYAALRNRGLERISRDKTLEAGMYDLSLAESFAPLDEEAANWRSWAQLYVTANSFFGINWEQAAFYFDVVYNVAPGIQNDVYWKFSQALHMYASQLAAAGDPCEAEIQIARSMEIQENEELEPTATVIAEACLTATAEPTRKPKPTETPTPEAGVTPTETPTPEGG